MGEHRDWLLLLVGWLVVDDGGSGGCEPCLEIHLKVLSEWIRPVGYLCANGSGAVHKSISSF